MQNKLIKPVSTELAYRRKAVVRTIFTFQPSKGERSDKPSQTLPEQGLSIMDMLHRVQKGLPINSGGMTPVYNGQKLLPDWKSMDLVDRQNVVADVTNKVEALKAKRKDFVKKAAARRDAFVKKAVDAQKEAAGGPPVPPKVGS